MKKLNFGERMKLLKKAREQEKALNALFTPGVPLTEPIQKVIIHPLSATSDTPASHVVQIETLTPLERTIQRLREQARKI